MARKAARLQFCTYCFHLEDMVRRGAFARLAIWATAMGSAIALIHSRFGHVVLFELKESNM